MSTELAQLSPEGVAFIIGEPLDKWPGNCHGIAHLLLARHVVEGKLRYGHYLGPVVNSAYFQSDRSFQRHGWIEMEDGSIVDPTRWVFEGVEPYIYVGPNDHYDAGGNLLRAEMQRPCPMFRPPVVAPFGDLMGERDAWPWLLERIPKESIDAGGFDLQLCNWLGNTPLQEFARRDIAAVLFAWLVRHRQGIWIPYDNRKMVEEHPEWRRLVTKPYLRLRADYKVGVCPDCGKEFGRTFFNNGRMEPSAKGKKAGLYMEHNGVKHDCTGRGRGKP